MFLKKYIYLLYCWFFWFTFSCSISSNFNEHLPSPLLMLKNLGALLVAGMKLSLKSLFRKNWNASCRSQKSCLTTLWSFWIIRIICKIRIVYLVQFLLLLVAIERVKLTATLLCKGFLNLIKRMMIRKSTQKLQNRHNTCLIKKLALS